MEGLPSGLLVLPVEGIFSCLTFWAGPACSVYSLSRCGFAERSEKFVLASLSWRESRRFIVYRLESITSLRGSPEYPYA